MTTVPRTPQRVGPMDVIPTNRLDGLREFGIPPENPCVFFRVLLSIEAKDAVPQRIIVSHRGLRL